MFGRVIRPFLEVPRDVARIVRSRLDRRAARKLPRSAIGELDENVVGRIAGTIELFDGQWLEAPLSQRTCVYYSITIQEHFVQEGALRELASEQRGLPFVLVDHGARAVIDPQTAKVSTAYDHRIECKGTFDAPPLARALLDRFDLVRRNWFWTNGLVFREAILEVGERVAVIGAGTREPDPDAMPDQGQHLYRDAGRTRLRITGTQRSPITITDDPGALD